MVGHILKVELVTGLLIGVKLGLENCTIKDGEIRLLWNLILIKIKYIDMCSI